MDLKEFEKMAKLEFTDEERERANACAEELISGFSLLEGFNTDGVEPLVTVLEIGNILREDIAEKNFTRDEILSNAPDAEDGFFRVPKTVV